MSTNTESGVLPNVIFCSLPEQPRDVRCDLHPTRTWVLACPDSNSGDSDSRFAAIFDYKRRTLVFAIHPDDQAADSPSSSNSAASASSAAGSSSNASNSEADLTKSTGPSGGSAASSSAVITQRKDSFLGDSSAAAEVAAAAAATAVAAAASVEGIESLSSSTGSTLESSSKGRSHSVECDTSVTPRVPATPRTPSKSRAVPAVAPHTVLKSEQQKAPGTLRFMKFLDADVRAWKRLSECSIVSSEAAAQAASEQLMSSSSAYAIVVYDNRVVLFNYICGKRTIIFLSELRGVPITALEIFSTRNYVAFGGSDGSIRLWDVDRREIVRVLTGGHKSSADITALLTFADDRNGKEYIVSGGSDGLLCLWNTATGELLGTACKAHDGGVNGMFLRPRDHVIVTAGDKGLAEWTYSDSGLSEARRAQNKRTVFGCISGGLFSHPQFPADCVLTLKKDSSEIFASNFDQTDYRPLTTFNDIHGSIKKEYKGSKIYSFVVHPSNPLIFSISTAKGTFVVKFDDRGTGMPVAFDSTNGGQRVFYEKGCNIMVKNIGATPDKDSDEAQVVSGLHSENIQLVVCNRGLTLFCVSPSSQTYSFITRNNSTNKWTPGEEKPYSLAVAVASGKPVNSSVKDRFAILEPAGAPLTQSKRGNPTSQSLKLVIYQMSGAAVKPVSETPAKNIKTLFSGQLLGVVTGSSDSKEKDTLQFYNWGSLDDSGKVCGPLPAPERVIWDPEKPQVALLYKHSFVLYRLENGSDLSLIMSGNETITSLVWSDMRVYTASSGYIKCFFYDVPDMPIIIACNTGDCSANSEESPSRHHAIPLGPFELLGENSTDLLVLDYNRQLHRYPTASDPYLSACIHASLGHAAQTLERAKDLNPRFHEAMALFLVRRDFVREALQLEGLSVWWKLQYCVSNQLLTDAIPLLKSTAKEFNGRNKLKRKQSGKTECSGILPFIDLFDLTQPVVPSKGQREQATVVHPTKDELMTVAGELSALCRTYVKPADVKAATSLTETGETEVVRALAREALDCVSEVDPPRYFMLLALHLALTKAPSSELSSLYSTVEASLKATTDKQDVERLKDTLLFVSACADEPNLVTEAWERIKSSGKKK